MSKHKNPRHDPFWPSEPIASLPPDRLIGMRAVAAATGLTTSALWLQVKEGRTPAPWKKVRNRWVLEVGQLGLIAPKVPAAVAARRGRETQANRRAAAKAAKTAAQAGASGPNAVSAGQDIKAARTAPAPLAATAAG